MPRALTIGDGRGGRRKLRFEWIARHGRPLKHEACVIRQESEFLGQRTRNSGR